MPLFQELENIRAAFLDELKKKPALSDLETLKVKLLGRKGRLNDVFKNIRLVADDNKKQFGHAINELKQEIHDKIEAELSEHSYNSQSSKSKIDLTLPEITIPKGSIHPLSQTLDEIVSIFHRLGFDVTEGPEVETEWNNFDALNIAKDHPARDMQDTFFLKNGHVLRTHTSPTQIRLMQSEKPPIRSIMPGRVYRNESINSRSYCLFHQVEGLYIDENVTFSELKATLDLFFREYYGSDVKVRFRPSYFPFTEPSSEVDVSCNLCGGKGCRVCKYTGWLETLGCGMVDPKVFQSVDYDAEKYTGYAFGMGIERMTMLKYGINDLRLFYENDHRFLEQF
jgi:phenylalanyl-tRNA synthetase alpha chain